MVNHKLKVGDRVKLMDINGCKCNACQKAKSSYQLIVAIGGGDRDVLYFKDIYESFDANRNWKVLPPSFENK